MAEWRLVGRADVLRKLSRAAAAGRSVVVHGQAGCGKSRLVQEHVRRERGNTIVVRATAAARDIPLGAFAPVLPEQLPGDPLDRLRAAEDWLAGRAEALVVDDAHLLDAAGATLVHQLLAHDRMRAVLTVRAGEPAPDAIASLWKDELAERILLAPLDTEATVELASAILGGEPSLRTAEELWARTGGNPLALRELLFTAREAGALHRDANVWHLAPDAPVPSTLTDAIVARVSALDDEEREALQLIALADPAPLSLVTALGITADCERLEARELVTVVTRGDDADVRPDHPLHAEAIRSLLPALRRQRLVEALGKAAGKAPGLDPVRAAAWQLDAGLAEDPELLCRACELARPVDPELAVRLADAAIAAGAGSVGHALRAESLALSRRHTEASSALAAAEETATTDAEHARAAVAATRWVGLGTAGYGDALAHAERIRDRLSEPDALDQVDTAVAMVGAISGDLRAAGAASARVLARPDASDEAVAVAYAVETMLRPVTGRTTGLGEMLDRAERHAGTLTDPVQRHHLAVNRIVWHVTDGRIDTAIELGREMFRSAGQQRDEAAIGFYGLWWVLALEMAGLLDEAAAALVDAERAIARSDPFGLRPAIPLARALVEAQRGDARAAASYLGETAWREVPHVPVRAWAARARIWTLAVTETPDEAADVALSAGEYFRSSGAVVWAGVMFHDSVRIGRPAGVAARLEAAAAEVDSPEGIMPAMAAHASAAATDDPRALTAAAKQLAATGMLLAAAEANGRAAVLYDAAGQRESAARCAAEAESWLRRCQGAATPGLVGWRSPLTAREREIAELAVRLSSRQIAERLVLSVRTVDNHLANVYGKLGISGRDELAATLGTAGSEPDDGRAERGARHEG